VANALVWLVAHCQTTKIGGIYRNTGVFKFHRQTSRARRWVQGILQKISLSCLSRLITEIQADECTAERYSLREGQDMHDLSVLSQLTWDSR
jgi:hypothetical protein